MIFKSIERNGEGKPRPTGNPGERAVYADVAGQQGPGVKRAVPGEHPAGHKTRTKPRRARDR